MLRWIFYLLTTLNLGNLMCFIVQWSQGVVAHIFNPHLKKLRQVGLRKVHSQSNPHSKFQASLDCHHEILPQKPKKVKWNSFYLKTFLKSIHENQTNWRIIVLKQKGSNAWPFQGQRHTERVYNQQYRDRIGMNFTSVCFFWHLEGKASIDRD